MAAVSAALAVAIGVLSLPGPQASAGELRDKQKHAHRQVEKADEALEESSAALRNGEPVDGALAAGAAGGLRSSMPPHLV